MARVVFPDFLLADTGGQKEISCAAENFRDLLLALDAKWPGLQETLDRCAVAIDGQIYQDAFLEPLELDSEVFFMQRLEGG